VDVAQDPELFVGANDLQMELNPLNYPGYDHVSAARSIDLDTESFYQGTVVGLSGEEFTTLVAKLEGDEENNTPSHRFAEVAIFDNASSIGIVQTETGRATDNMILYGTFDPVTKNAGRVLTFDFNTPAAP
jgi:hypothetical protein